MRKITRDAVNAFLLCQEFKRGNTEVRVRHAHGASMYLHGNLIAASHNGAIDVSSAGWETPTTKERLNGLLAALGCQGIHQRDFSWYWEDGQPFESGWQPARPVNP